MKLRVKFILFIALLHLTALVLSLYIFRENKLIFIASELVIIISIILCWQLYKQLIQPLKLLMQGIEAMKDRDFNVKLKMTGQPEMDELISVYNQMSDALRNERTRQEQQHLFLEKIIQTSPTGILVLDFDERIHQVNPSMLKLLNMPETELLGKPIAGIDHSIAHEIKDLPSGTSKIVSLNGINTFKVQKSHFMDRGFARHFVMAEELTAEIYAAEKKAYGKVIRMMAHEVNNTIGPVNSIIQSALVSEKIWQNGESETLQHALQVAFDRNNSLRIFMRNFSEIVRLPKPVKTSFDLHELIRSMATFTETMAKNKKIAFTYEMADNPFMVIADRQQMEQVLINVVKNSIEAIDAEGIIRFTTNTYTRELTITDNGRGIEQQDASQLFTPFFSTKRDGTGIGLTLVKEVLMNHDYYFSLQTISPGLTVFRISLPA